MADDVDMINATLWGYRFITCPFKLCIQARVVTSRTNFAVESFATFNVTQVESVTPVTALFL